MNLNFRLNPLIDFNNLCSSMQLDSDTVIATLDVDNCTFTLKTLGLVRVVWNPDPALSTDEPGSEVYKSPCQFPDDLMKIFEEGRENEAKNLFVDNSNWFSIVVYRDGEFIYGNDDVELPPCTPDNIFNTLWKEYLSFMDVAGHDEARTGDPGKFKLRVVFGREASEMTCDTDVKTTLNAIDSGEIAGGGGEFKFDTAKDRDTVIELIGMADGWDGFVWEKV